MTEAYAVKRGLKIQEEIKRLNDELKEIESLLESKALAGEQVELEDADREGRQYIAMSELFSVPVIITADLVINSFIKDSANHTKIAAIAGDDLKKFYSKKTSFHLVQETGKAFRQAALQELPEKGAELISACTARDKHGIAKNSIKVDWSRSKLLV